MIIVDYNGIAMANIMAQDLPPDEAIVKYTIINSLRSLYAKHKAKYGDLVIAADAYSWRRDHFSEYKYTRRQARDDDAEYWEAMFKILNKVRDEIKEHFPWKVFHIDGAEADDVIAVLVETTQEFGRGEPVLIWAADSDYRQLQKYGNVVQWSNQQKKYIKEPEPVKWLFNAICTGQKGKDGIPNIRTRDNFYVEKSEGVKGNQSSIAAKQIEDWWTRRKDIENIMQPTEWRNFCRNRTLIDFAYIPDRVRESILAEYEEYVVPGTAGILPYIVENRLNNLIDNLRDFYP